MKYIKRVDCEVTLQLDETIVISASEYESFKKEFENLLEKYRL
jgi:hypothetical protein